MRIVLDLQACQASSRHRGIGRYSMALAQAMARQAGNHELSIVLNRYFPEAFGEIVQAFDGLIPPRRITTFDLPLPVAEFDPQNAWRARAAEQVREASLAQMAPDFVHVSSLFEGLVENATTSVGQSAGRFPTAVTLYDLIPLLRKETYLTGETVRRWYYRKLQSLKNSELLLAISGHSRQEALSALQLAPDQIVNISSAVDAAFAPRTLSPEERQSLQARYGLKRPFVMYTGGIDYRKNIEGLIDAFTRLPAPLRKQYQLAIVCNIQQADRTRLETLAKKLGLADDDLVLTGFVSDADLLSLYNCTALFVFPSLQEGFGLPALEAMSCGVATIGSNTSSIPEVIGRADALFDPTDTDAITAKMHEVLTDAAFRSRLQAHGLEQAKLFSWDASGRKAIAAFEEVHARRKSANTTSVTVLPMPLLPARRLRLAFLSPLPPEQSGIADYSAQLLPELARHYDIDVIVDQETITDDWVLGNFPVRSVAWFDQHAARFDRIIYHFGNSAFHTHMFETALRYPGVVVLHDFFLSGIVNHFEAAATWPNAFCRSLYESHGYPALLEELREGREAAIYGYPCNKQVLDHAAGVIVHSQYSMQLARQWYGPQAADAWRYIPLLKAAPAQQDRRAARAAVGFGEEDFLVCTFGHLGATKLNHRLLDAWLTSPLARDPRCHLVFVGASAADPYCTALKKTIEEAGTVVSARITITGFASSEMYRAYLSCADIAVQLRARSRGETSAAILDCLSYGIATVINANGSAAELRDDILVKLPDEFSQAALCDALTSLWQDQVQRKTLAQAAAQFVEEAHQPSHIGDLYRDAIETFHQAGPAADWRRLVRSIAAIDAPVTPSDDDLERVAACMVANRTPAAPRQLLIDVTPLIGADPATAPGAAAAAALLRELVLAPPAGYRIEPFHDTADGACYARHFSLRLIGRPELVLQDDPVGIRQGDRTVRFIREDAAFRLAVTVAGSPGLSGSAASVADHSAEVLPASNVLHDMRDCLQADFDHLPVPAPSVVVAAALPADPAADERATAPQVAADASDETESSVAEQAAVSAKEPAESHAGQSAEVLAAESVERSAERAIAGSVDEHAATNPTRADDTVHAGGFPVPAFSSRNEPQLLVDITMLVRADDKSGIQRVVRSILKALLEAPPAGFTVRPVYHAGGYYAYAQAFATAAAGLDATGVEDDPIHLNAGDIFLGLDLSPNDVPGNVELFADFRRHDVQVYFVVYDLLPVLHPEVFHPGAAPWFTGWLDAVTRAGDGVICISRAVANDLTGWLRELHPERLESLRIGYFHLGADIAASLPSSGATPQDMQILDRIRTRPSFLMVGTLEPRKSHAQVLHAFELLWESGVEANLVIVGKEGWMVEGLANTLREHPENGRHLFWLERVSDELLLTLYDNASALVSASIAEGFGLPLIEAAMQSLPIITRDLPVFREVCGEHATYFKGDTAAALADTLRTWLALDAKGQAPQSAALPHLTWAQSARQLTDVMIEGVWYRVPFGN